MNDGLTVQDQIELARTRVRAALALMLIGTLCSAVFAIPGFRELLIGGLIGSASTALIFYFE
jgi:hypothetical protein